ncbi:protein LTV1 homolog isoform X2 [Halichondria panicea]|uniref:protein LTV1 homolog isoform X2 n=1 Tax=Halichondria panicea TaxID=6063 RepID=UPI00312B7268
MGRKKKPFIDKKNSQTYRLVPRSQQDPLAENVDEAQHVLKALQDPPPSEDHHLQEQFKYGIDYEDEYDYLQHLKEPGTAVLQPVRMADRDQPTIGGEKKLGLPGDLFGTEVAVEGKMGKILPVTGPQPGWDPDIVAALEEAEMNGSECEGDLDDDFVLLANSGEPGIPVYVTEETGSSNAPWWKNRVDFSVDNGPRDNQSDPEEDDQSNASSDDANMSDGAERKSTRFTQYSLSSSVVPRSETLTLLDDRFEEFMAEYDDNELGAVDEGCEGGVECEAGGGDEYEHILLQSVVENYEKHFKSQINTVQELLESERGVHHPQPAVRSSKQPTDSGDSDNVESDGSEGEEELPVLMEVAQKQEDKWDCESILSTYSNLYNHPTKIVEPGTPSVTREQIKLSSKSNLPLGVIPGSLPKERQPKQASVSRPRHEEKDEKRARKAAIKEDRKQRRADKKATKLAFKSESMRLEKQLAGRLLTAAVV